MNVSAGSCPRGRVAPVAAACAYALARLRMRGRGLILSMILAVSMFPQISIVGPLYLLLRELHLLNTYPGLVLPYLTFSTPLAGHNDLRAYLLEAAEAERWFDLAIERHWVSGDTVLAAWHASWTRRSDEGKVRQSGVLVADVAPDERIARLRYWTVTREYPAGEEGTR